MKRNILNVDRFRSLSLLCLSCMAFAIILTFTACSDNDDDLELLAYSTSSGDESESDQTSDSDDGTSSGDESESDQTSDSDDGTLSRSGTYNGYDYVDLGLSVKWGTINIGADSPEDYGNYYAWGETETKNEYSDDNYSSASVDWANISSNATYDAATANWGGSWRMPTYDEIQELIHECTWTWTTQNSIAGFLVTGVNGTSIFLPAAGYITTEEIYDETTQDYIWVTESYGVGSYGDYWSSIMYNSSHAYTLIIGNGFHSIEWGRPRYAGQTIRPVLD